MAERTLYEQIDRNRLLTACVVVTFNVFVLAVAYFGVVLWWGFRADSLLLVAAFLAVGSLLSYFGGDSLIRATLRPSPLKRGLFPEFDRVLDEMCLAAGIPGPRVFVLPTGSLNAMVVGRNAETASLVITLGCLQDMDEDELRGVVAHELAHILNYDVSFNSIIATLVGAGVLVAGLLRAMTTPAVEEAKVAKGKMAAQEIVMGNVEVFAYAFIVMFPLVIFFFGGRLIQFFYSRQREYQADAIAVQLTRNPEDVIKALIKLEKHSNVVRNVSTAIGHMFTVPPENWMTSPLLETHPRTEQRIERLANAVSLPVQMPEDEYLAETKEFEAECARQAEWDKHER